MNARRNISNRLLMAAMFFAVGGASLCSGAGPASAQSARMLIAIPDSSSAEQFVAAFEQVPDVAEAGFSVETRIMPPNVVLDAMASGVVDAALVPLAAVAGGEDAYAQLLLQPQLADTLDEQIGLQGSLLGSAVMSDVESEGLLPLGFWNDAPSGIVSSVPIVAATDLQGLKVRTPSNSALGAMLRDDYGASTVEWAFSEVYPALRNGAIDAAEVPLAQRSSGPSLNDLVGAVQGGSIIRTRFNPGVVFAGLEWYLTLTAKQQRVLGEAIREAQAGNVAELQEHEEALAAIASTARVNYTTFRQLDAQAPDGTREDIGEKARELYLREDGLGRADALHLLEMIEGARRGTGPLDRRSDASPVESGDDAAGPMVLFATDRRDDRGSVLIDRFPAAGVSSPISCGRLATDFSPGDDAGVYTRPVELYAGTAVDTDETCVQRIRDLVFETGGRLIVMIPGFANTFETAMKRGLSFARDVDAPAPVLIWSWPSLGITGGRSYSSDEAKIGFSRPHLEAFLEALAAMPEISRIDLVSHSMGGRLASLIQETATLAPLKLAIYVAPDVPTLSFAQRYGLPSHAEATLYASKSDYALTVSEWKHKDERAGRAGAQLFVAGRLDTIDTSTLDRGFFSCMWGFLRARWNICDHYNALTRAEAVADLRRLVHFGDPAEKRDLRKRTKRGLPYYEVEPAEF
ncbi:alpha/beta fold hydrolase [Acuticoccus sp. I52.16.1]|uniref:alpha/beta fold hydrolase n=1 Tax=Acuticoccus sp. I52.16.1 TaxID=2928472 RepID=UPI001FD48F4B|nr:alpha/beta fold hydrolase [Acuticoccus sp. I52.16.1]UOM36749.1 alpha/beta fold hydrolase [Acuticoccus sp. I52.16.1]